MGLVSIPRANGGVREPTTIDRGIGVLYPKSLHPAPVTSDERPTAISAVLYHVGAALAATYVHRLLSAFIRASVIAISCG